jgi:hypothetical protein
VISKKSKNNLIKMLFLGIMLFYKRISFSGLNSEPQIYHHLFIVFKLFSFYFNNIPLVVIMSDIQYILVGEMAFGDPSGMVLVW